MAMRPSRRRFLAASAALGASSYFLGSRSAAQPPAGERVRIGVVGVAGQGEYNLNEIARTNLAEIVALCDVDANRATAARNRFPKAAFHEDYRRMMEMRDLQAVLIATPDHHHAPAAMQAMRAGKHVYCEKPLAHSVHEVRTMMQEAARQRLVTQMGTQIHAGDNYRRVVEIVQGNVIGPVRRVHVWNSGRPSAGRLVADAAPVPRGLNYDLWLGPVATRHYPAFRTGDNTSPHFHWRWWWDFGGGVLADLACHYMDLPHWALNLRQPTSVASTGRVTYQGDNQVPDVMQVDYEYPARGNLPAVQLTWQHGVSGPSLNGQEQRYEGYSSGILFIGERGNLVANYGSYRLMPEDRFRDVELPRQSIARSVGHHREWLQAIRTNGPTTCNFDYSGALSETVLLGNVAYRAGGRFTYDARTGEVAGNANAAQYLRRDYRRGWTL